MKRQHTNLILILILILAAAWAGGCRSKQRPTKQPTPQRATTQPTTAPAPTKDAQPPEQAIDLSSEDINAWLQENAIPFDTAEPGGDYDDLMPLKDVIGDARIVALGEATHGTREFFLMKHRLLEFLVKEMDFDVFAIEATWPESYLVNDYVHTGQGDPAERLAGLYFWTWNTQEVLDMILWMRAHNEDPGDAPAVSFLGFDMQSPGMAMDNVVAYLEQVDPDAAEQAMASYSCFRNYENRLVDYATASPETQAECRASLQAVHDELGRQQAGYEAWSSPQAFALALQSARVALQAEDVFANEDLAARDRYMAENTAWLLDQAGPDAKIVLWAHNGHVGTMGSPGEETMGSHLRESYGDDMVVLGFAFYQGGFNAFRMGNSGSRGMTAFQVALPPEGSYEHAFHGAGLDFFLDLREVQPGSPVTDWLLAPHHFRSIGAAYDQNNPKMFFMAAALPQVFDVLVYFQDTSPSQLLDMQAIPGGPPPVQPTDFRPENLDFEDGMNGWMIHGHQDYAVGNTIAVAHQGSGSGYVWSMGMEPEGQGILMQTLWTTADYQGRRLRVSAYLKTEGLEGQAGLWLSVDTPVGTAAHDNMQDRSILGDTDWTRYELVLDAPPDTALVSFGAWLEGVGKVWVDDFQVEVVGQDTPTTQSGVVPAAVPTEPPAAATPEPTATLSDRRVRVGNRLAVPRRPDGRAGRLVPRRTGQPRFQVTVWTPELVRGLTGLPNLFGVRGLTGLPNLFGARGQSKTSLPFPRRL